MKKLLLALPLIFLTAGPDASAFAGVGSGGFDEVGVVPTPPTGPAVDMNFATGTYVGGTLTGLTSVTRATPATTYAENTDGTLTSFSANTARVSTRGLLIEESRANLTNYSNFTSGVLTGGGTLTANSVVSPDGTTNAAKFILDSSTGSHYYEPNSYGTIPASVLTYTYSFYIKRTGALPLNLEVQYFDGSFGGSKHALFDLGNGTTIPVGGGTTACTLGSASAFYHCFWTFPTDGVAGIFLQSELLAATTGGVETNPNSFTGDGASGVYVFGQQLELGATPTSCIPTAGSTVTRSAEVVTTGGALQTNINAAQGTIVVSTDGTTNFGNAANIVDSNGTALIGFTSADVLTDAITSGLSTANTGQRWYGTDNMVLAWDATGRALTLDGGTGVTDAVAQTPNTTQHLGSTGAANFLNGYIGRLRVWNTKIPSPTTQLPLIAGTPDFIIYMAGTEDYGGSSYFPTTGDWNYLQSKGFNQIRLTIAWENLQPTLNAALNSTYLTGVQTALANAAARNMSVILDIQNYGWYCLPASWGSTCTAGGNFGASPAVPIGNASLPASDFTDLWTRIATALVGTPGLAGYELMNEPAGIVGTTWSAVAQNAINAIRAIDATTPIWVAGDGTAYAAGFGAARWSAPAVTGTNLVYTAHAYFDAAEQYGGGGTYGGTYTSYGIDNYTGVKSIQGFLNWCILTGNQCNIGEFGIPNSGADANAQWFPTQLHVMSNLVQRGIPADQTFYGGNTAGSGSTLYYNPIGGVDDPRLIQMQGNF